MKSAALQQAIYTRLNDTSVTSLLSTAYAPLAAIFTDVPQAADPEKESDFPLVVIGAGTIAPYDTKDAPGGSALVQIDVWDRATSMLDLKAVCDAIDARLRRQSLSISGATHITTELESVTFARDPDGKTKRALILYRVLWLT